MPREMHSPSNEESIHFTQIRWYMEDAISNKDGYIGKTFQLWLEAFQLNVISIS
jgi:hypothetical protein